MADIQNSKLLWTKAGLFVVVAILAMVLTFLGRYRNFVPFLFFWSVSIWASCRAYYFAFYAVEKYVDPNFKYAGIGSMVEYVLGRQRQPAMQTMGGGEGEPSRWLSPFARLSLRWLVLAAIANMVVPTLLPSRYGVYFDEYVNFLLLGLYGSQFATISYFGALVRCSTKYRIVITLVLSGVIAASLAIGLWSGDAGDDEIALLWLGSFLASVLALAVFTLVMRVMLRSTLEVAEWEVSSPRSLNSEQVSFRYIFAMMAVSAVLIAVSRLLLQNLLPFRDLRLVWLCMIWVFFPLLLTIIVGECVLRERRSNRLALGLWLLLASAVLYAFPYLFDFLLDLVSEGPVPLLQHDIGTLWLARGYFVLFMIGNAILFYAFRSAGVRLRAGYPGKVSSQEKSQ